jgi:hypothetical protein
MKKNIAQMLRERDDDEFKQWFADVMTTVTTYGDQRAKLAIVSGSEERCPLTEENYAEASPLAMDAGRSIAHLRDLIGGKVVFRKTENTCS